MAVFVLDKSGKPLMPWKTAGRHIGRVAIRATGSFNFQTAEGVVQGVSHRYCKIMQCADGYGYSRVAQSTKESGHRGDASRRALSLTGLKADVSRAN